MEKNCEHKDMDVPAAAACGGSAAARACGLLSVQNNLFKTRGDKWGADCLVYCLRRMKEETGVPQQGLIATFLQTGMEGHPLYGELYARFRREWEEWRRGGSSPAPGTGEGGAL